MQLKILLIEHIIAIILFIQLFYAILFFKIFEKIQVLNEYTNYKYLGRLYFTWAKLHHA